MLLSISSFIHSFLYNRCVFTSKASQRSKEAKADTATSGHVDGHDDSNRRRGLATATTDTSGSLTRRFNDDSDRRFRRGATAKADTTVTSGHVNGHDDSDRQRRLATATADTAGLLTRRQRDSGEERTRQRRQRQAIPTTSTATKQR